MEDAFESDVSDLDLYLFAEATLGAHSRGGQTERWLHEWHSGPAGLECVDCMDHPRRLLGSRRRQPDHQEVVLSSPLPIHGRPYSLHTTFPNSHRVLLVSGLKTTTPTVEFVDSPEAASALVCCLARFGHSSPSLAGSITGPSLRIHTP